MIHDDPAYSSGQYSLGDYYYGHHISQPIPQHATSSFPPPENTLGLDLSIAHPQDPQSVVFQGGDLGEYSFFVGAPYQEDAQNLVAVHSSVTHMPELLSEIPGPPPSCASNLIHQNISPDGVIDSGGSAEFPQFVFGSQYGGVQINSASPYDLEPLI